MFIHENISVNSTFVSFSYKSIILESLKHHWEQGYEVGDEADGNLPLIIMHISG